jgi:AraC-like DNA-binding protein
MVVGNKMTMGIHAAERCDDFGWQPRGAIDPSLTAEIMQHPRYGMGHAWSRSAGYALTQAPSRIYLVLTVEGAFEFDVDGATRVAEPGTMILLDGEAPTTARTLAQTARFVWYLEPTFLEAGRSRFRFGDLIPTGGSSVRTLMSVTNAAVTEPPRTESARRHLGLSFEHLLAGVLDEAGRSRLGDDSRHADGLFMAAQASIDENFRDPAFDLSRLARGLGISVRTVHETFRRMGTTPRREIERRRVNEVKQLKEDWVLSLSDLAERTGFTSARQLSRALARQRTNSPTSS